jgi:hypothetical protein
LVDFLLDLGDRACLREEVHLPERHELVRPERGNIDVALEWTAERGEVDLGLRLVWYLEHYWVISDPAGCLRWIDELLARGDPDSALRARAHRLRGGAHDLSGRTELALPEYESALALFRGLGDEDGAAHVEHRIAADLIRAGEIDRAEAMLRALLEHDRRRERRRDEAIALGLLAEIAHARGDDRTAAQLGREAAKCADEVGFSWWRGLTHLNLAEWLTADGDPAAGAAALQVAAEVLVPMGDLVNIGFALATATWISARLGDAHGAGLSWGALEGAAEREPARGWRIALRDCARWGDEAAGDEFERGRERGRKLSPEEALAAFAEQVEAAR